MLDPGKSRQVRDAIQASIAESSSPEEATEAVMNTLSTMRVAIFDQTDPVPLMSTAGRVLASVTNKPSATIREMALQMGAGESNVQRSVSSLVKRGLISRTRAGRQNFYEVNWGRVWEHPDVQRFALALMAGVDNGAE